MNMLHDLEDRVRAKARGGEALLGAFLLSGSSYVAEAMAHHPIDWLLIDMEASHASRQDVLHVLQALNAYPVTPVVRVPAHEKHQVEACLDLGARGVMIPKVDTREQAEVVAGWCFYPPKGTRSVNCIRASGYYTRARQYFDRANEAVVAIVQVESGEAVQNAPDLAAVDAVDVLFVGPGDLAASYGQTGVVTGKRMDRARRRVVEACLLHGKIPGIFAHSVESAGQYLEEGFRFVALGNDVKYLSAGLSLCLDGIRRTPPAARACPLDQPGACGTSPELSRPLKTTHDPT